MSSAGHEETVDLRLDVLHALGVGLEPGDINLNVEVTNVCRCQCMDSKGEDGGRDDSLHTMASFFMAEKCSPVRMSRQPVVVTKI